jgi:L-alanine-DL-glutamate epimerase-like enolase superfamily enzyme
VPKTTDVRVVAARLHLLPVATRVPLKFGAETLTHVTCARAALRVADRAGRTAEGWGETPLSVQWGWPSAQPHAARLEVMVELARRLTHAWPAWGEAGHPLELGTDFTAHRLPSLAAGLAAGGEPPPRLAALITAAAFDLALHDAYGRLLGRPTYATYTGEFLNRDLAAFLETGPDAGVDFRGRFPADFLRPRADTLTAWHLIGGLDPLEAADLRGDEPADGHPVLLADWIARDGLTALKVKLRGDDAAWDFRRLARVGDIAAAHGVTALSADFNCTVREPAYVEAVLDRLRAERPGTFARLLYVEQPFPHDLEAHPLDVRGVAARRPLFLDESAHDWRLVRLGRRLGWTGVALKTCKTQGGTLLSLCWARAHGLALMVQDLTNPMLAQLPHLLLAAHAGTLRGVETNAMQFYPDASAPEAAVHPGCHRRRDGVVRLESLRGPGFGYRLEEIRRELPPPAAVCGEW